MFVNKPDADIIPYELSEENIKGFCIAVDKEDPLCDADEARFWNMTDDVYTCIMIACGAKQHEYETDYGDTLVDSYFETFTAANRALNILRDYFIQTKKGWEKHYAESKIDSEGRLK